MSILNKSSYLFEFFKHHRYRKLQVRSLISLSLLKAATIIQSFGSIYCVNCKASDGYSRVESPFSIFCRISFKNTSVLGKENLGFGTIFYLFSLRLFIPTKDLSK